MVKFFIEGVCTSLLGLFGIIGNLVSMAVLSSSELDMMPSFRHLLKMLAAFDATFLVFTLTLFGISPWSDDYDQFIKPYLMPYFLPIIQVGSSVFNINGLWPLQLLDICLCHWTRYRRRGGGGITKHTNRFSMECISDTLSLRCFRSL